MTVQWTVRAGLTEAAAEKLSPQVTEGAFTWEA